MSQDIVPSYLCRVQEVVSGDDLVLMVDLGVDDLYKRVRARLKGVDTPSAYKQDGDAEAGKVRTEVRNLIKSRPCRIDVHSQGRGGWVVTLFMQQSDGAEIELNQMLRERGFVYSPKQESRNGDKAQTTA